MLQKWDLVLLSLIIGLCLGVMAGFSVGYQVGPSQCRDGNPAADLSVLTPGMVYQIRPLAEIPDLSWAVNENARQRWVLALPIAEGSYKVVEHEGKNELRNIQ